MSILFLIIGLAVGYFFKPQIDKLLKKAIKYIKDKSQKEKQSDDDIGYE